jgi:hypothetical protein
MSDLVSCLIFVWYLFMFIGVIMLEYRLSRIQRLLEQRK